MEVKCPSCKKKFQYSKENEFRPFCSERCKMIDLGKWFEEDYKIAKQFTSEDEVDEYMREVEKRGHGFNDDE